MNWNEQFTDLFDRCVTLYRGGNTELGSFYSNEDLQFLRGIGCKPRELFDFIEDYVDEGDPTPTNALLIAEVRRDYLEVVQGGQLS